MSSEGLVLYTTLSSMQKSAKILMFTAESSKTQFFSQVVYFAPHTVENRAVGQKCTNTKLTDCGQRVQ